MKTSGLLGSALFLFMVLLVDVREAAALRILTPPDHATIEGGVINLVFQVEPDAFDELHLLVNDKHLRTLEGSAPNGTVCLENIELASGRNAIKLVGLRSGQVVTWGEILVFRRTDLSWNDNVAPSGFSPYRFHSPEHESLCAPCHQAALLDPPAAAAPTDGSACLACHRGVSSGRYVHGPSAVGACQMCHNGSSKLKNDVVRPVEKICTECHADSLDEWNTHNYSHGPVAMGSCSVCHDPHSSDYSSFLRLNPTQLCGSCHYEIASRPHVISSFSSGEGHPVWISPDPMHSDRDFSCVSCHNPHAGNSSVFLQGAEENGSMMRFCTSCHQLH